MTILGALKITTSYANAKSVVNDPPSAGGRDGEQVTLRGGYNHVVALGAATVHVLDRTKIDRKFVYLCSSSREYEHTNTTEILVGDDENLFFF